MESPPPALSSPSPTDAVLLARFVAAQAEDREAQAAFAEVVRRHTRLVYESARRALRRDEEAQDVTQKVFSLLADKVRRGLQVRDSVGGWLHRTAVLCSRDAMRAQQSRTRLERAAAEDAMPVVAIEDTALAVMLDEALAAMPVPDRDLLWRRYGEGVSCRELSAQTGKSEAAVQRQALRALERLAARLRRRGIIIPAAALSAAFNPPAANASLSPALLAARALTTTVKSPAGNWLSTLLTVMKFSKLTTAAAVLAFLAPVAVRSLDLARERRPSGAQHQTDTPPAAASPAEAFPQALVREITAADPDRDLIRFLKLAVCIGSLTKQEVPVLWKALSERDPEILKSPVVRAVFSRWAELDADEAVSAALTVQGGTDVLTGAWQGVASVLVPREGIAFFSRIFPGSSVPWESLKEVKTTQDAALVAGLQIHAPLQPAETMEILYRIPEGLPPGPSALDFGLMYTAATANPEAVWSAVSKLPDSDRRDAMVRDFCTSLQTTTPAAGVKLLTQPGSTLDSAEYLPAMMGALADADPRAAIDAWSRLPVELRTPEVTASMMPGTKVLRHYYPAVTRAGFAALWEPQIEAWREIDPAGSAAWLERNGPLLKEEQGK